MITDCDINNTITAAFISRSRIVIFDIIICIYVDVCMPLERKSTPMKAILVMEQTRTISISVSPRAYKFHFIFSISFPCCVR